MKLIDLGWNSTSDHVDLYKDQAMIIGRVVRETRHIYSIETESGRKNARVSGQFHYNANDSSEYPVIGDWTAVKDEGDMLIIDGVLPRKSSFSRKVAGEKTEEQVIAANMDVIFIVFGLDGGRNFTVRGLERYLTMAWDSGAEPIIILNKVDVCEDPQQALYEAESAAMGVPVYLVSAHNASGIDDMTQHLSAGKTAIFLGPSGVGKSALSNVLLGREIQRTGEQRKGDLRGRHTTTNKELLFLSSGAMIIDSPGLRELQLWGDVETIDRSFREIAELAKNCRFTNCSHQQEPGCAVQQALVDGSLDYGRFENYRNMSQEMLYLAEKQDVKGRIERKTRDKKLAKKIRQYKNLPSSGKRTKQ